MLVKEGDREEGGESDKGTLSMGSAGPLGQALGQLKFGGGQG